MAEKLHFIVQSEKGMFFFSFTIYADVLCFMMGMKWKNNGRKNKNFCLISLSTLSKAIYIQIDYGIETHCFNSFNIGRCLYFMNSVSTYKDIKCYNAFWIYWYKMHYINCINPLSYWSAFTREGKLIFNVVDIHNFILTMNP